MKGTNKDMPTQTDANAAKAADEAKVDEKVQRTAFEIKVLNDADLLKADAQAISDNVRVARENLEKTNALVAPATVTCTNLDILDNVDNRVNPAIQATKDALLAMDIPVNVDEYLYMAHLIANALKTPDLSNLDKPDTKAIVDRLHNILKDPAYYEVGEEVQNVANLAIGAYDASMTSLRDWGVKSKTSKTSSGPTSAPMHRDIVDMAVKLRAIDKVRQTTGWDVEYVCGDHKTYGGKSNLSSLKHQIRGYWREWNNLDNQAGEDGTPEWAALGQAIQQAVNSDESFEWGNGYIHRIPPKDA